jgi:glycosyltransferase involved in cell wall biosynthesis
MAEAVSLLLAHPDLRRQLGGRGRSRAIAEFTWDRVAARIELAALETVGG